MSELCIARGPNDQRVVLRTLRPEFAGQRKFRADFLQGAELLQQLSHPNINKLLNVFPRHDPPCMVLEYIEGESLRNLIINRDELISHILLHLLRQMADTSL